MIRTQADETRRGRAFRPLSVAVVGGGFDAHLAALMLKEHRPDLDVTLVGSSRDEPATIAGPEVVAALFGWLGLPAARFVAEVAPVLVLGNWHGSGPHPEGFPIAWAGGAAIDAQAHDGHTRRYGVAAQLMGAGRWPIARVGGRVFPLLKETPFGLALDPGRALPHLAARARAVGIEVVSSPLGAIERDDEHGVRRALIDGHARSFDLWIDADRDAPVMSALDVPFDADDLPTDSLAWARVDARDDRAHALFRPEVAGFVREIPLGASRWITYRYAATDATSDDVARVFMGATGIARRPSRVGHHRAWIAGNAVAIGEGYGAIDPITGDDGAAVVHDIERLLTLLQGGGQDRHALEARAVAERERLRWLAAVAYRFERRLDSAFWRRCHVLDWSGAEVAVKDLLAHGAPRTTVFGPSLDLLLLGLGVVPERLTPAVSAEEWRELIAMREGLVGCALAPDEARPTLAAAGTWHDLLGAGWCREATAALVRSVPPRGRSPEALAFWSREAGVSALLGRDADKLEDAFPTSPNIDFGKFIRRVPDIVLRPRDQAQLAECLQACSRRRTPVTVRAAAHSSGGQTLTDDGAVIDLRWLKRIVADAPDEQRIRVESGLWWLELCGHLRASGRRPLVLTDNWRSTVGGTLAVGGFGDATHRDGLQIAGVRELTVMTMDGTRHRAKPGDDLFDWSLAGRGQLGVITEVVLETVTRSYDLHARVVKWPTLEEFITDARRAVAEGRFDWLRARVMWSPGCPVGSAAGHMGEPREREFVGLVGRLGASDRLDLFERSSEAPNELWAMPCPGVEIVLPATLAGVRAIHDCQRALAAADLVRFLGRGSSIMPLSGAGVLGAFPMAPVPDGELALMVSIRPEIPPEHIAAALPVLRSLADRGLDAGGKVYLMGLEPTTPDWLQRQLGPERHARLRALKAKWDPDGLLNPGLVPLAP